MSGTLLPIPEGKGGLPEFCTAMMAMTQEESTQVLQQDMSNSKWKVIRAILSRADPDRFPPGMKKPEVGGKGKEVARGEEGTGGGVSLSWLGDKDVEGYESDDGPVPGSSKIGHITDDEEINEHMVNAMWDSLDKYDVATIDAESLRIFEFEGFNPSAILRSLMIAKKQHGVSQDDFMTDIITLCGLAILKGNINSKNLPKMKAKGQEAFKVLQRRYTINISSSKGKSSDFLTVARVAAAFPGKIIQLLQSGKVSPREYMGPLRSNTLPAGIRHQAMAACIPRGLAQEVKTFLLGLIVAFSVDQTMVVTTVGKPTLPDCIKSQFGFINVAHNGTHPSDKVRREIFKSFNWSSMYSQLITTASTFKIHYPDFVIIEEAQYISQINSFL